MAYTVDKRKMNKKMQIPWIMHPDTGALTKVECKIGTETLPHGHYSGGRWIRQDMDVIWKPNEPFLDVMTFVGIDQMTSSYSPQFLSQTFKSRLNMHPSDFDLLLTKVPMMQGTICGWWYFRRSGSRIYLVLETQDTVSRKDDDNGKQ